MHGVKLGAALVLILVGVLLFLLRDRGASRGTAIRRASTQAVIGTVVGAGGAGLVLSTRVDLVPDRWESYVVALLGVAVLAEAAVVLWLKAFVRAPRGIVRS